MYEEINLFYLQLDTQKKLQTSQSDLFIVSFLLFIKAASSLNTATYMLFL